MKKTISICMAVILLLSCMSMSVFATDEDDVLQVISQEGNITYYEDGFYAVTTVTQLFGGARSTTVTCSKSTNVYNADGVEVCALTVVGTFSVNSGTKSVACTSATYTTNVYVDGWSIASPAASYSNHGDYAKATATGTAKQKVLGITTKSIPLSVSVNCYWDGTYN
ncbi:MAG: hypothetical protein ACI4K9_08475 [Candidatus Fimenecus sp.]